MFKCMKLIGKNFFYFTLKEIAISFNVITEYHKINQFCINKIDHIKPLEIISLSMLILTKLLMIIFHNEKNILLINDEM